MKLVVIDGQGGGIGKSVVALLHRELPALEIVGVGANSAATEALLKAGAVAGATGENAVIYNCRDADVIVGAVGIVCANAMCGEISPRMAEAVASSDAKKLLIPINKCNIRVLGVAESPLSAYLAELVREVKALYGGACQ